VFAFFDKLAFSAVNFHGRAPVLDMALPLFSDAWLLWAGLAVFLGGYTLYCRRHYG
jgi:hypothetical protein